MKQQSTNLLSTLSKEEVNSLTKVVKETLATEICGHVKIFSAADLWNIQRQRRSFGGRRNFA